MTAPEAAYKHLPAHEYLVQWGAWLREGNQINIGRLTSVGMGATPGGIFHEDNEHRAIAVQKAWASLVARSLDIKNHTKFQRDTFQLFAFVLKLEYIEWRWTREEMANHVSKKLWKPKYSTSSLQRHLYSAVAYVNEALGLGR